MKHCHKLFKCSVFACLLMLVGSACQAQTNNAFGDNMAIVDSIGGQPVFAIYSGDVNQDGVIDGFDFSVMESDVIAIATGYKVTDVNGDGVVDGFDFSILERNVIKIVAVKKP